jgi:hypothetical protein
MKPEPKSEIILYQTEDNRTRIEVRLDNETVWLTQNQMAELFQTSIPIVSMHIRNIFKDNELPPDSVVKEFLTTAADGKKYCTRFYNLDVIISVGYRVKSHRGTQFSNAHSLQFVPSSCTSPVRQETPTRLAAEAM